VTEGRVTGAIDAARTPMGPADRLVTLANRAAHWLDRSVGFICLLLLPGYNNRKKAGQQHTGVEN